MWTYIVAAILQLLELLIVYKGLQMSASLVGWFYVVQQDLPSLMQAISFCLVQITVSEFAPPGMEASLYEFLLTATNISITVGDICTTMMQDWLGLTTLSGESFRDAFANDLSKYHEYQNSMTIGLVATAVVSIVSAVAFSYCMPKNPEQCREWASWKQWQVPTTSAANFGIVSFMIIWSLEQVTTTLLHVDASWLDTVNYFAAGILATFAIVGVGIRIAGEFSSSAKASTTKEVP